MQEMHEIWVWTLGQEDSPGGENGNPLHYSFLKNPMDRRAWWAAVHRVTYSQTQLSSHIHTSHEHSAHPMIKAL